MIDDVLVRNLFNNSKEPAVILKVKSDKIFIEAINHSYADLIGLNKEEIIGLDLFSVVALADDNEMVELKNSLIHLESTNEEDHVTLSHYSSKKNLDKPRSQSVEVVNALLSYDRQEGSLILHKVISTIIQNPESILNQFSCKSSGESPETYKAILEAVFEMGEEPFVLLDNQFRVLFCSSRFQTIYKKYYGGSIEIGCSIIECAKEERRELLVEIYTQVLSKKREQLEILVEISKSVFKKFVLDFKPIIDASGNVERICVSGTDVSPQHEAMRKFEESERELGLVYDNLQDGVFVIGVSQGTSFTFLSANRAFFKLTGLIEKDVLNSPIHKVIPNTYIKRTIDHYLKCISIRKSLTREGILLYPSGEKTMAITITPVFDSLGSCLKLIGSMHDITNLKKLERIGEAANSKLSKILESSPDVICTLDEVGRFLSLNAASIRMWGYRPEQLMGKYLSELLHGDDREHMLNTLNQIVSGIQINHFENRLQRADGSYIPLLWSERWDAQERIIYCVAKDETEKKAAEDRLKASEQRFKTLIQDGADLIAILDLDGNYLYVSASCANVLGTQPEEYLGKNAFDFIHPEDKDTVNEGFIKLSMEQRIELAPFRFLHHNGTWRWVETILTNFSNDPSVNGIVANSRDITEKINAQRTILQSNERYQLVSKATFDAVWDLDLESNKIYWGDGFQRIFNWPTDQVCSNMDTWSKLVHPDDLSRVERGLYELLESSENQWFDEYRFLKADGAYAVVLDRGFVVRDDKGKAVRVVGAVRDVTKLRKKEHQLKLFESVVTQTGDLVVISEAKSIPNSERKIIYVNQAFCQLTGYTSEELIGQTFRILHGKNTSRTELEKLSKAIEMWQPCEVSIINYKKNGQEFWNNFLVNPITDEQGLYTHWISIGRDISGAVNLQKQEKLISSISQIFNRTAGLVEAIDKTMKLLTKSGNYVYSEVWTEDHGGLHLSLMGRRALSPKYEVLYRDKNLTTEVKKSQGFVGEVWKEGEILSRVIFENSENSDEEQRFSGTLFGLPLFYNKKPIGVLLLGSRDEGLQLASGAVSERLGAHFGAQIRRKQLEEELEQVFDFAPDIIAISDFDGYIKKINPAANALLGYTAEEMISKPFTEFLHPEDKKGAINRVNFHSKGNSKNIIEERYLTKAGEVKWLSCTMHAIADRGLVFSVAKDITEKKDLEELLRRSNSLAKVGSWEINVLAGTVYWSDVTREIREADLGFEPDLNTGIDNFKKDIDKQIIRKKVDECIAYGFPWDEELEILTFKGNSKWVRTIGQAEMVDGKCKRIFGSFQDIDVRKRAEIKAKAALKELEKSEKRYSDLFHLSPNPMWVYDYDTLQFMDANKTAISHYGYSHQEFLDMTLSDIRPQNEIVCMENAVKLTRKKGWQFYKGVFKHQKKTGEIIDVEIKSNIITFNGKKAKVVLVNDITERQIYFKALEKQNELLREISWVQSHVVRAPLAKLMGLVTLLGKRSMQNVEKQRILIENIECCTAELDEIIRGITKKSEQQEKLSRL